METIRVLKSDMIYVIYISESFTIYIGIDQYLKPRFKELSVGLTTPPYILLPRLLLMRSSISKQMQEPLKLKGGFEKKK